VFLQNYKGQQIFRINELFFYWKIGGLGTDKPNSNSASFGRFLEVDELRVGYGMETEFPGQVNSVKEKYLIRNRFTGLVGLALGYVSGKPG
jgi:hypothetical protein